MEIIKETGEIVLRLSSREIRVVTSAMNEICHGASLPKEEFPSRVGATKEEVVAMLDKIIAVARTL